jgi:hypothetical protein
VDKRSDYMYRFLEGKKRLHDSAILGVKTSAGERLLRMCQTPG